MDQEQIFDGGGTERNGIMQTEIDVKEYRKKKTLELVDKYKSLIEDVFRIFNDDKGSRDDDDEKDDGKQTTEQKKLEKIKKRSAALEQVEVFLNKIENLEHHLRESNNEKSEDSSKGNVPENGFTHPTKANARSK